MMQAASAAVYDVNGSKFEIRHHQKWKDFQNLYGLPFLLINGEEKQKFKDNISITPVLSGEVVFKKESLETDFTNYKKGRLEWLKKSGGQSLSFHPLEFENNANKEIVTVGHSYSLSGVEISEHSYFIKCHTNFYHIKSLSFKSNKNQEEIKGIVKSFTCKK